MSWTQPTYAEFQTYFARDFNFAPEDDLTNTDYVTENDFDKAIGQALINFNNGLFGSEANATIAFMHLVAFYLVYDLQTSAKGISSQGKFPINSTSVGSVSVSYDIPERYKKDPYLSFLIQNGYGLKYLSLAIPATIGNVGLIEGTTTAG